ncbi:SpaH/EbpB family LPXTG-anchored major pilin [Helcococcus ovis]|uniref:Isopeptide-forming domain-containing fimbrial protein n=1 Tax=Helcococcus ovis TaxID=72026 RepID=A0A4R9C2N5_9FIRM|nr:SpaH/EbpB family LPXTG-anchored major pilin [Helcococcus ovis]TFF64029.1 isopeptide-forming domain-containing fimbrial protein [Helcococcus ovis]TFF64738.1 isopeptide-forming domain-containing fimbrial protein [Helcococcus ovis]
MKKRIISAFMAFIMVFTLAVPGIVGAAEVEAPVKVEENQFTGEIKDENLSDKPEKETTVIIHKLQAKKYNEGVPVKHNGGELSKDQLKLLGTDIEELDGVEFNIYKIKDEYLYNLITKNPSDYNTVKKMKDLVTKNAVNSDKQVELLDLNVVTSNKSGATVKLEQGYYWIIEAQKPADVVEEIALPFSLILPLSTEKDGKTKFFKTMNVYPKNVVKKPEIDKNFAKENELKDLQLKDRLSAKEGAKLDNYSKEKARVSAEISKEIPYEVITKVPKGASYRKFVLKDIMTNGLTFNKNVKIMLDNNELESSWYTKEEDSRGFEVKFTEKGLTELSKLSKQKDVIFTLKYSANVNGNAIVDNPEKNDISLEYGNTPNKEFGPKTEVKPKDKELIVSKTWYNGKTPKDSPDNVKVVYSLYKQDKQVVAVTLDKNTKGTFDLGNGILFEAQGKFNGKFIGLDENEKWKLFERVSGYDGFITSTENGKADIKNIKDIDNPTPLKPTSPEVVVGGKKFVKTNDSTAENSERLLGATFIVKKGEVFLAVEDNTKSSEKQTALTKAKSDLENRLKTYNDMNVEKQKSKEGIELKKEIDQAQEVFNKAFKNASIRYTWVSDQTKATTFVSDSQGRFEVNGLEYGEYELVETIAPKGYAKLTSNIKFEVKAGSSTIGNINYKVESKGFNAQQIKNKKISIPQTGGIGTVIFTVAGLIIMGAAIYALKKNNQEVDA